jgi:DNA-binding transcriptional LysR family regulator
VINLWQLHVFLVVYEMGSFSAAATHLHMTQPGVSQQIRALESHLGTSLFVRRGHGVELTAAGADLLDPARRLLNLSETTERTLMARRGEVSGRIRLGSAITSAPFLINPWLAEFRGLHPDVTMQIEYAEPGPMLAALRAQDLDGGFVLGRMRGRGLVHHKINEDPITLIVPLNHAWTSPAELGRAHAEHDPAPSSEFNVLSAEVSAPRGHQETRHPEGTRKRDTQRAPGGSRGLPEASSAASDIPARVAGLDRHLDGVRGHQIARHEEDGWYPAVKPAMLKDQPMVLEHGIGESHSDARRALNDALEERGLSTRDLRVVLEVPDPATVACAVAEGLGIGLVPQSIARRFVGQVVPVRIEGFTLAQHVYLIRDRKALHSPAVGVWWRFISGKVPQRPAESPPAEREGPEEGADLLAPAALRPLATSC